MGLRRTHGLVNNKTQRLRALAAELDPARPPFYVDQPERSTPAQGWYWVPAGERFPTYLGHNSIMAEVQLRTIIQGHDRPAA